MCLPVHFHFVVSAIYFFFRTPTFFHRPVLLYIRSIIRITVKVIILLKLTSNLSYHLNTDSSPFLWNMSAFCFGLNTFIKPRKPTSWIFYLCTKLFHFYSDTFALPLLPYLRGTFLTSRFLQKIINITSVTRSYAHAGDELLRKRFSRTCSNGYATK